MTGKEYISHFSRTLRWRISYQEAQEAITDYEELFCESGKKEEEVCQELGDPKEAARLLGNRRSYLSWLVIFSVLLISLLLPAYMLLSYVPRLSFLLPSLDIRPLPVFVMAGAGVLTALFWFKPRRQFRDGRIPATVFLMSGALLLAAALLVFAIAGFFEQLYTVGITELTGQYAQMIVYELAVSGGLAAFLGILAVIRSRTADRRFRAVYILSLTLLLACTFFLHMLVSSHFDPDRGALFFSALSEEIRLYALMGGTGLIAAGVSLC